MDWSVLCTRWLLPFKVYVDCILCSVYALYLCRWCDCVSIIMHNVTLLKLLMFELSVAFASPLSLFLPLFFVGGGRWSGRESGVRGEIFLAI